MRDHGNDPNTTLRIRRTLDAPLASFDHVRATYSIRGYEIDGVRLHGRGTMPPGSRPGLTR